jgi:hypothetical protein
MLLKPQCVRTEIKLARPFDVSAAFTHRDLAKIRAISKGREDPPALDHWLKVDIYRFSIIIREA